MQEKKEIDNKGDNKKGKIIIIINKHVCKQFCQNSRYGVKLLRLLQTLSQFFIIVKFLVLNLNF